MTVYRHETAFGLALRALEAGAERQSIIRWYWDISSRCERPITREVFGRPDADFKNGKVTTWSPSKPSPQWVVMDVKCRRCPRCLRARQYEWAARCNDEILKAERTWFGTLTLRPELQDRARDYARLRMSKVGLDFDALDQEGQFLQRHLEISKWITKYLKRLRKEPRGTPDIRFRYCMVVEPHKTWLPHYHMLLHEFPGSPIGERKLRKQWGLLGFAQWKLVREESERKAAWYVAKYLTKTAAARMRASQCYGSENVDIFSDPVSK